MPPSKFWAAFFFPALAAGPANEWTQRCRVVAPLATAMLAAGCASGPPPPAYPAFVDGDLLPEQFMASLPGVRARQFSGDAESRSTSNRVDLPPDWHGTTGGAPGQSLEIFVLGGELRLADVELREGGYAYIPPGSLGFNLVSDAGARILYFRDAVNPRAMIRTPIVLDSGLVDWAPGEVPGTFVKELRNDPGSGARTWLWRVEPGAVLPWAAFSAAREGVLVSGQFRQSECVDGVAYTDVYAPGGYFNRPAEAVSGGPQAAALTGATWLLREARRATALPGAVCGSE
jgi:hypothetical protein